MNTLRRIACCGVLGVLVFAGLGALQQDPPATSPTTGPATRRTDGVSRVVYRPPPRGAPKTTWGGGTRGENDPTVLAVLLPPTGASTVGEQPTLFWYVRPIPDKPMEISLSEMETMQTVLRTPVEVSSAGIQRFDLARHNIKLKPEATYRWAVAIVVNRDEPSKNIVAGGFVVRMPRPAGMDADLSSGNAVDRAAAYAERAVWCEALAELGDALQKNPQDPALRQVRAELLRQVGLEKYADE
jgi:hypothetical protein